jgi:hypothetical protein
LWISCLFVFSPLCASRLCGCERALPDTLGPHPDHTHSGFSQSFTPHSTGSLVSLDVHVGVAGAACEPLTFVLVVVDGLPQSFDVLTQWADAAAGATPSPSLLYRQTVTTTCSAAVCTARECLGWESIQLSTAVQVAENRVVSFALVHVQSAVGSGSPPRIAVVPAITGSTGRSSLLVSPIFHVRSLCVCVCVCVCRVRHVFLASSALPRLSHLCFSDTLWSVCFPGLP